MKAHHLSRLFLFFTAGFIASCSHTRTDPSRVFCYNENNGIATLDPAFARELEQMWATNQLFDGLVELDSNLNIVPSIASAWTISEDGTTYRFIIRDGVYFHPSPLFADSLHRKVTAHDFVYSFNRILDPRLASPGQWIFARVDRERNGGFVAENDSTLVIHLTQPFPPFLGMLTTQYASVVPKEVIDHYGTDFRSHPIGTGPFRFAFWYENIALVFHRFEHFWQRDEHGQRLPYLDAVKIEFVKDAGVEFQGLLSGKYDFISGIHPSYKDELLTPEGTLSPVYANDLVFRRMPFVKTDYLGFVLDPSTDGGKNKALLDARVRRALHHAIDRAQMVRYLRNNTVIPAEQGFVPPVLLSDSVPAGASYNPAEARRLLREAGYPDGNGLPVIQIAVTGDYADLVEFIQYQWSAIGVRCEIQVMQLGAFREATANNKIEVFRKSWLADYADPENFLAVFYSGNFSPAGPNYTHFRNDRFDRLYEQASSEPSDSLRHELYLNMAEIIRDSLPVLPLFYDQVSHTLRKNVHGLPMNPVNMLDLKRTRKSPSSPRS